MKTPRETEEREGGTGTGPLAVGLDDDVPANPGLVQAVVPFGRHYLSNATCLIRPHLFYAFFVVSTITMHCYMVRHF